MRFFQGLLSAFPPFVLFSWGLGTLSRVCPAGRVGRAAPLIHPQRALWLNRLAQGHWEELREAGGKWGGKVIAWVKLFELKATASGPLLLWKRGKRSEIGNYSVCCICVRSKRAERGTQPDLEEPVTPHTFMASPIREEGGRTGELQRGRDGKKKRKSGRDVFHKCSSIKSTDPNGIQ